MVVAENNPNRVIEDLKQWQQMEKQWKDLLGPQVVQQRDFMLERLRHLKDIPKQYRGQGSILSKDEKFALKLIKGEIGRMEKALYPNAIVRAIMNIADGIRDVIDLIRTKRQPEAPWKPTIVVKDANKRGVDQKEKGESKNVGQQKSERVSLKNDKRGPNRDIRKNDRIDDGPLLVKLKTGTGKGLKQ